MGTLLAQIKWAGEKASLERGRQDDVPGIERFPMNLIEGTRSAWAAACRSARVKNILSLNVGYCVLGWGAVVASDLLDSMAQCEGKKKCRGWLVVLLMC